MKTFNFFILSIITFLISTSCSKEWLKPDPLSVYTPGNVFVDAAGFETALVNCKKDIMYEVDNFVSNIGTETIFSDIGYPTYYGDWRFITPSWSNTRYKILPFFTDGYRFIKNTNTIISRIDDIKWGNQEDRNRILSSALWFRSYWYYRLVNSYGDVPWVGEELAEPKLDFYSTKRSTILQKIQQDLEFAANNLPEVGLPGEITKGAANHLLAKVYLANKQFDNAIQAASNVINGPYQLMKNRFGSDASKNYYNVFWDLHRPENKNLAENKETIYATVERADQPSNTWNNSIGTYMMRTFGPSYWKVLDATGNRATNWDTPSGDSLGIGNGDCRPTFYYMYGIWEDANYTWNNTPDIRRADCNWINMLEDTAEIITVRVGSPNFGEPLTKKYYKNLNDTIGTWWSWPNNKIYIPTPNYSQPLGGPGDMYIFRLAETYLLRAEAHFWKGDLQLAANDINEVRARANAPLIDASDLSIDFIFDERARELFTEEPRHCELVRVSFIMADLNKEGYNNESFSEKNWFFDRVMKYNTYYHEPVFTYGDQSAFVSPFNVLWPIPESAITANILGRINQNKGYLGFENNEPPLTEIP